MFLADTFVKIKGADVEQGIIPLFVLEVAGIMNLSHNPRLEET